MHLNPTIRKIEKMDTHFIYDCLCQLKNEKLDFKIIESILEENTRNPNYHYLIAENEQNKLTNYKQQDLKTNFI